MRCTIILFVAFLVGCMKAPSPIEYINKEKWGNAKITIVSIENATEHPEITTMVKNIADNEIKKIPNRDKKEIADLRLTITEYHPLETKYVERETYIVPSTTVIEKDESKDTSSEEETSKFNWTDAALCLGILGGACCLGILANEPTSGIRSKRDILAPIVGLEAVAYQNDNLIYQASNLVTKENRIPGCFITRYGEIFPREKTISKDFFIKLAVKELIRGIPEYKSPTKAMFLATIIPGAGHFYGRNYLEGVLSFIGVGSCAFLTYTFYRNIKWAPEKEIKKEDVTKTEYRILTGVWGFLTLGAYIFQIIRANDAAIVYNYKQSIVRFSSLGIDFDKNKINIFLAKNF